MFCCFPFIMYSMIKGWIVVVMRCFVYSVCSLFYSFICTVNNLNVKKKTNKQKTKQTNKQNTQTRTKIKTKYKELHSVICLYVTIVTIFGLV
jgi:hypothetical protein